MAATTIYFGTNRRVLAESPARFGNDFNAEKPYCYRVGEVRVTRRGHPWRDGDAAYETGPARLYPETAPTPAAPRGIPGSTRLFDAMRREMRGNPRDALVYLHGFANSFESAMARAAELSDAYLSPITEPETGSLARRGRAPLVFAFAWPSDARTVLDDGLGWAYAGDREEARASGQAMARCALRLFDWLDRLARAERCLQRVHLVAHSMGNWALRNALQALVEMAAAADRPLRRVFDTAFLMASDIEDRALERATWLAPLFDLARGVAVYHAGNDRPLTLSDIKPNQGDRLGHLGPRSMQALPDRVQAIDCAAVSRTPGDGILRHQYYRLAPEVLRDVRAVLAGRLPGEIPGRVPVSERRWRLRRDDAARARLGSG
ncbi:hypothetical protein LNKW23_47620 [Paralimibaculum aggregatum]|uniref:Alpha/beta hydrolase n=1 Tax=Paralimibaculum aggregatum TaxID=3036245 RepID=A0ABQ6LTX3_9RHOB|nr:alpha/beta hydrolase [Limibaculum sp. NKW23]GMG85539.1 hypothetical protein LNKW23_47620 [Limibaculum sp. NKW23]